MNKERRSWINQIISELESLKDDIENVGVEEQEAYENLPESIQNSERGESMFDNASDLEDAVSNLDDIICTLRNIIER